MNLIKVKEALDCLQNINLTYTCGRGRCMTYGIALTNGKTQVYDTIANSIGIAIDILNKVSNGDIVEVIRCDRCLYFEKNCFVKNEIQRRFWHTDNEIIFADGYCKLYKCQRTKNDFCSKARLKKEAIS